VLPSRAKFESYLAAARAIPDAGVRKLTGLISLVTTNGARGAATVLAHEADLATGPAISIAEIRGLPDRASALAWANNLVLDYGATADVAPVLARGRVVRRVLLDAAAALVNAGVFDADDVARIRSGRGAIDAANDLLALARLFDAHRAAIAGKSAITTDHITEAATLGEELTTTLKPVAARQPVAAALRDAQDMRNRMWTLYETVWEDNVWRAGAWLFKRAVDDYVPALHARVGHKRPVAPAPAPAPSPSPSPAAKAA
jgi:hypothetical protein